jgi:hypothetical protein
MKITRETLRNLILEVLNEQGEHDDNEFDRQREIRGMGFDPSEMEDYYDEIYDDIWYSKPKEEVHPKDHDEEMKRRKEQERTRRAAQSRFSRVIGNPYIDDY